MQNEISDFDVKHRLLVFKFFICSKNQDTEREISSKGTGNCQFDLLVDIVDDKVTERKRSDSVL